MYPVAPTVCPPHDLADALLAGCIRLPLSSFTGTSIVVRGRQVYGRKHAARDIAANTIHISWGAGSQSASSNTPSILNALPVSAVVRAPGLALPPHPRPAGIDRDVEGCKLPVDEEKPARRQQQGAPPMPSSQTLWQETDRATVGAWRNMRRAAIAEPAPAVDAITNPGDLYEQRSCREHY